MTDHTQLNEFQAHEFPLRLARLDDAHPGYARAFRALEAAMCRHGGHAAVVAPWAYLHLEEQLTRSALRQGTVEYWDGAPSECHANAARRWVRSSGADAIVTGFALSTDGLWREHSWNETGAEDARVILESTCARVAYFGMVCDDGEALAHFGANVDEDDWDAVLVGVDLAWLAGVVGSAQPVVVD